MKRMFVLAVLAAFLCFSPAYGQTKPRNVTFISTSDSHYRILAKRDNNDQDHLTLQEINAITKVTWPAKLGGEVIEAPRGVVMLGDCIDDGDMKDISAEQHKHFVGDFGLDGTDGFLKFPVFEGWGNHDGPPAGKEKFFSFQANLKKRNLVRKEKGLISNLSANGLHYSWDWDDVHFVQLNLYPADKQREGVHYSPVWHDPQLSLSFLKQDLKDKVGNSGRPVVLMAHCGFDTDWWVPDDWKEFYDAVKAYNVVLYLYGHSGTGLRDWAPSGETKKLTCINDGQTTKGFFVIQIAGDRLRAAYRTKAGVKIEKKPDGTTRMVWPGQWEWKYPLDKKLPS